MHTTTRPIEIKIEGDVTTRQLKDARRAYCDLFGLNTEEVDILVSGHWLSQNGKYFIDIDGGNVVKVVNMSQLYVEVSFEDGMTEWVKASGIEFTKIRFNQF